MDNKEPTTPTSKSNETIVVQDYYSMELEHKSTSSCSSKVHQVAQKHDFNTESDTLLMETNTLLMESSNGNENPSESIEEKPFLLLLPSPSSATTSTNIRTPHPTPLASEDSGRERLKRHRVEVAGSVWIPDIWGQEELLKDWIDCTAFEAPLVPSRIMSARAALAQEGRRANPGRLRVENRC